MTFRNTKSLIFIKSCKKSFSIVMITPFPIETKTFNQMFCANNQNTFQRLKNFNQNGRIKTCTNKVTYKYL